MKSKHREEAVYLGVKQGWIEIRPDGSIWRIAQRYKSRWDGSVSVKKVAPHRIDAHVGAGYRLVKLMVDGIQMTCSAHRLVWLHFRGSIPENIQINHKNGVKSDNRLENLELASASENVRHALKVLRKGRVLHQSGEKNHAAKISDLHVEAIRAAYAAGRVTQRALAEEYGVKHQAISKIVRGDLRVEQKGPVADYTSNRRRGMRATRGPDGRFHS